LICLLRYARLGLMASLIWMSISHPRVFTKKEEGTDRRLTIDHTRIV